MRKTACAAFLLGLAPAAAAQTISVHSIDSGGPAFGTIVSSAHGESVFRIAAADGSVVRVSGTAVRLGGSGTRGLVTFTCTGDENACLGASTTVTISAAGGSTGRAGALANFTVAPGPNPPAIGAVTPGVSSLSFDISGIPAGGTRSLYVGADLAVEGEGGGSTGTATSGFAVAVAANVMFGQAEATIMRPINLARQSDLSFGTILRPTTGTSSVTVAAADGARSLTGGNGALIGTSGSRATYVVTGEGGQIVSIGVPAAFIMRGPGDIEVTLDSSAGTTGLLSAAPGAAGSLSFGVGGTMTVGSDTPPGDYVGTFEVVVQYN